MARVQTNNKFKFIIGVWVLTALSLFAISASSWVVYAADEPAAKSEKAEGEKVAEKKVGGEEACCKAGDQTPPIELAKKIPPGGLVPGGLIERMKAMIFHRWSAVLMV